MSTLQLQNPDGRLTDPKALVTRWKDRIERAREHQKPMHGTWQSNSAFAAGQHWMVWQEQGRQLRHIQEIDSSYRARNLYTADRITEYRAAALGEMVGDDERPQLLTAQDSNEAEEVAQALNDAVEHGWSHEWTADSALAQSAALCFDLGVSAIRCRRDPSKGPLRQSVPTRNGKPVTDLKDAYAMAGRGEPLGIRDVHDGQTCWEPLSAWNLLTPPGLIHEDAFPWDIVHRPVLLDDVRDMYGSVADKLQEDTDIASILGLSTGQQKDGAKGRLRDHVWLFTCYQRPNSHHPKGQVVVLASNQFELMDTANELDYQAPDGTYRTGIHYFHWWRLTDRFHSRAGIENLKDGQRVVNELMTSSMEIIRRGGPKVFTHEGDIPQNPTGAPLEVVELKADAQEPKFFEGIGPGPWMQAMKDAVVDDMSHASTISPLRLGENPERVDTYSQLALLNDNEAVKRSRIRIERRQTIARLVEDSVWDIRQYWPDGKMLMVTGDDDQISQQAYQKSKIPDFFLVKTAEGSTLPRQQGAELKKIEQYWAAASVALAPAWAANPDLAERWLRWYVDSTEAGKALDLPEALPDSQSAFARFENTLMFDGDEVAVADYDLLPSHLPVHREGMDQARAAGDVETYMRFKNHIDAHVQAAQQNAAKVAEAQQTPAPPGLTPAPPPAQLAPPPQQIPPQPTAQTSAQPPAAAS